MKPGRIEVARLRRAGLTEANDLIKWRVRSPCLRPDPKAVRLRRHSPIYGAKEWVVPRQAWGDRAGFSAVHGAVAAQPSDLRARPQGDGDRSHHDQLLPIPQSALSITKSFSGLGPWLALPEARSATPILTIR